MIDPATMARDIVRGIFQDDYEGHPSAEPMIRRREDSIRQYLTEVLKPDANINNFIEIEARLRSTYVQIPGWSTLNDGESDLDVITKDVPPPTRTEMVLTFDEAIDLAQATALKVISDPATLINNLMKLCNSRAVAAGWYHDLHTGERIQRNKGEVIALMHSELSEALESFRKNTNDDHLPHRFGAEVEFADALIRILDTAADDPRTSDLGGAFVEKLEYNRTRADHSREARLKEDGKKI